MAGRFVFIAALALGLALAAAGSGTTSPRIGGKRTLAIVADMGITKSHSQFFEDLTSCEARGHQVKFVLADSDKAVLSRYGEWLVDNLVVFAPSATNDFGGLSVADILAYIHGGGNLLLAAGPNTSDLVAQLAAECGVDVSDSKTIVLDHFSYDVADPSGDHSYVLADNLVNAPRIVGTSSQPVVYHGVAVDVADDNVLAVKVLRASTTAYVAVPAEALRESPFAVGTDTVLVAAVQARNNARMVVSGSLYMFSNAAFGASVRRPSDKSTSATGNAALTSSLGRWTFQERGVLRASSINHHRADGSVADFQLVNLEDRNLPKSMFPAPEIAPNSLVYRIKDDLVYNIDLMEYDGEWKPYQADDVQLEFVMLDPYLRVGMTHNDKGTFTAKFTAPDVYGIFKFRIMYRRVGLSVIQEETQVSVRPFRHDEYERFIQCAYPYYVSAFAMMAGFFIFGLLFLYTKN